ncbi:hypothetical protein BSKO_06506 [Bryopsis sp. KO-2023]|nr:hypothetical protein BSKO_06506 [Bryopsis sp. KO-2023]
MGVNESVTNWQITLLSISLFQRLSRQYKHFSATVKNWRRNLRPANPLFCAAFDLHRSSIHPRFSRSNRTVVCAAEKMKVAVTGASGRTGSIIARKLREQQSKFDPVAVVRSESSRNALIQSGYDDGSVFAVDISSGTKDLEKSFEGCDTVILTTSGVPKLVPLSMFGVIWGKIRGEKVMPDFSWKGDMSPETADWIGGKNQIDAAKAAGVKRFIWVGSMGGTDPDNNLNKLGDGNILQWKRKGEEYLIQSGLEYTIIHPSGLGTDKGGEREIRVGVDDELYKLEERRINREDVAEACVQCVLIDEAANRAFDISSIPGAPNLDMAVLLKGMEANCDYTINSQLDAK